MPTPTFSGAYKEGLTSLSQLVDDLESQHNTSFVKAGDDKVYAFGGNGYGIVLDERKWKGLVEILTPTATISVRPAEDGSYTVSAANLEEAAIKTALTETVDALRKYYEERYWRTPKIA
jgi:hypothetical protein